MSRPTPLFVHMANATHTPDPIVSPRRPVRWFRVAMLLAALLMGAGTIMVFGLEVVGSLR